MERSGLTLKFIVRAATVLDVDAILAVHRAAVSQTASNSYGADIIAEWSPPVQTSKRRSDLANRISIGEELALVAELEDGQLAGFGSIIPDQSELRAVYVDPNHGSKGVGKSVLKELELLAREKGLTSLSMDAKILRLL